MKTRILSIAIVGLLLTCDLSLSQESASLESTPAETSSAASSRREVPQKEPAPQGLYAVEPPAARRSSSGEMQARIFTLKYGRAEKLAEIIRNVFNLDSVYSAGVYSDGRSDQLILKATKEQMKDVEALLEKLDVEDSQSAAGPAIEDIMYRVYMFEIPSKDKDMKLFSMILRAPEQTSSAALLEWAAAMKIQVSGFVIGDEQVGEQEVDILIQGKAPSEESIRQMAGQTAKSQIRELKWDDDETFTRTIEAAHYSRLPAQVLKHIRNFLGEDIETVGYWFGSSSIPGQIEAPIGPWMLQLQISPESDRAMELRVEVRVPGEMSRFDRQLGRERSDEILSNTIQAKIGKPIIVGYNRPSYGTRKMGAMVILPEADTIQLEEAGSPTPAASARQSKVDR